MASCAKRRTWEKGQGRLDSKLGGSVTTFGDVWAGWYSRAAGLQGLQPRPPEHISCDPHELSPSQTPGRSEDGEDHAHTESGI